MVSLSPNIALEGFAQIVHYCMALSVFCMIFLVTSDRWFSTVLKDLSLANLSALSDVVLKGTQSCSACVLVAWKLKQLYRSHTLRSQTFCIPAGRAVSYTPQLCQSSCAMRCCLRIA